MLVILFWLLLFIIVTSIILLIVFLVIKKKKLARTFSIVLIVSIIGFALTLKACTDKVKSDFGYREDTRSEEEKQLEVNEKQKELEKIKNEFEANQQLIDSLQNK